MPEPTFTVPTCRCDPGANPGARGAAVYERQARVLKTLANPARLQMVDQLSTGEASVGELTALVGLDQSTVSKHLAVLRAHGVVADRREGNMVYYRLLTPCVLEFIACADRVIGARV